MQARRAVVLVGAGALALGGTTWWVLGSRSHPDDPPAPPAYVAPAENVHALLVGCTEYPGLKAVMDAEAYEARIRLHGPANDVALLRGVLRDYLGVPSGNVVALAGWPDDPAARPTRANILAHLDRLVREVPRGARVLFHFAGHGSQQPDEPGGDEPDRLDEILLPADAGRWGAGATTVPGAITDDELRARLVALRDAGATVWAVLDCCHAGTMVRGTADPVRMRELPPDVLGIPKADVPSAASRGAVPEPVGLLAEKHGSLEGIAACYAVHSWQQAPEMLLPLRPGARDRETHGLCTFLLARTLQRYGGALTLAELHQHLLAAYGETGYSGATPLAEGDLGQRVLPGAVPGGAVVLVRHDGGRLRLDAGSLRGLTVGTVLEVFRPGGLGRADARVGTLRIEEVHPLSAFCGAVPGERALSPADVPDRAPCRVLSVAAGEQSLRLAVVDARGVVLGPRLWPAALQEALADPVRRARFPPTAPDQADWRLRVGGPDPLRPQAGPLLFLEPAGEPKGPALEVDGGDLVDVLDRLHRAENLRRLARGPLGVPLEGFRTEVLRRRFGAGDLEPLGPDAPVPPGDRLALRITNGSGTDVDVVVLSIDSSYVVTHVWPRNSGSLRLTATENDPVVFGPLPLTDDGAGLESLLVIVATRTEGAAPIDVGDLSKPPVQGMQGAADGAGAQALARDLAFGEASARGGSTLALHEVRWRTDWGRMGTPSVLNDGAVALAPPLVSPPEAAGDPRPPGGGIEWHHARVVKGDDGTADALLLWGTGGIWILVDEDGDAGLNEAGTADAARAAVAGTLPVEAAVLLAGGGRSSAYATGDGDGRLDVVLVDADADGQAEHRWVERGGAWTSREARGPWLSTLQWRPDWGAPRARVVAALRRYTKAPR